MAVLTTAQRREIWAEAMREIGREFLMLAEPRRFELPRGMKPTNKRR